MTGTAGFDIAVVGAGPAGCAAALTAHRAGLRVLLLGDDRARTSWAGESLPPGAGDLIEALFGPAWLDGQVRAHGTQSVWGSPDLVPTEFLAHPLGDGWHLDRSRFDRALLDAVVAAGVTVERARVTGIEHCRAHWSVKAGAGSHRARWVVDASGRGGAVVGRLNVRRRSFDEQVAVVAVVPQPSGALAVTSVEAVEYGWWYATPLPRRRMVVGLLTDRDLLPAPVQRVDWWNAGLTATTLIRDVAGRPDRVVRPRVYPAETSVRDRLHQGGWACAGDAAVSWDPLSSQGLVTGILMGSRLGAALAEADPKGPALEAWEHDYRMLLEEHLGLRRHYWALETRWPRARYWSRRR